MSSFVLCVGASDERSQFRPAMKAAVDVRCLLNSRSRSKQQNLGTLENCHPCCGIF